MELFTNIRLKIGKLLLSKKVARTKRKVSYSTFTDVRKIGIVWDASKTIEFSDLSKFHQRMLDNRIEVSIFGYFPGKSLPDQYTAIRYLTCLRKEETNNFFQPVTSEATKFIDNPFDVLIDINFDKQFPLSYITELSRAKLKVGLYHNENNNHPFDLMMSIKNPVNLENYLNEIIHYLEMIKDKSVKTVE